MGIGPYAPGAMLVRATDIWATLPGPVAGSVKWGGGTVREGGVSAYCPY